jgi:hypothetical protein
VRNRTDQVGAFTHAFFSSLWGQPVEVAHGFIVAFSTSERHVSSCNFFSTEPCETSRAFDTRQKHDVCEARGCAPPSMVASAAPSMVESAHGL